MNINGNHSNTLRINEMIQSHQLWKPLASLLWEHRCERLGDVQPQPGAPPATAWPAPGPLHLSCCDCNFLS